MSPFSTVISCIGRLFWFLSFQAVIVGVYSGNVYFPNIGTIRFSSIFDIFIGLAINLLELRCDRILYKIPQCDLKPPAKMLEFKIESPGRSRRL